VALGTAYASYRHGREFALRFGTDESTASIWPLIVDGLLTTATVELWKNGQGATAGGRWAAWLAFGFGISLSLCANVGSAPAMSVFAVTVAACSPLALLLAVELLNRALKRHRAEVSERSVETQDEQVSTEETAFEGASVIRLASVSSRTSEGLEPTAEERMWTYFTSELAKGRTPTGAELDRIVGTHNYGRRILRRWRQTGRLAKLMEQPAMRRPSASHAQAGF
jgi:hypothetical protein